MLIWDFEAWTEDLKFVIRGLNTNKHRFQFNT